MWMPVVNIAHMRVCMGGLGMLVFMGMPEGVIGGQTLQLFRGVVVVVLMLVNMTVTLFMGMLFFFSMSSVFAFLFICLYQRLRGIIGVFFFLLSFEFEDMLEIFLLKLFKTFVLGKF